MPARGTTHSPQQATKTCFSASETMPKSGHTHNLACRVLNLASDQARHTCTKAILTVPPHSAHPVGAGWHVAPLSPTVSPTQPPRGGGLPPPPRRRGTPLPSPPPPPPCLGRPSSDPAPPPLTPLLPPPPPPVGRPPVEPLQGAFPPPGRRPRSLTSPPLPAVSRDARGRLLWHPCRATHQWRACAATTTPATAAVVGQVVGVVGGGVWQWWWPEDDGRGGGLSRGGGGEGGGWGGRHCMHAAGARVGKLWRRRCRRRRPCHGGHDGTAAAPRQWRGRAL